MQNHQVRVRAWAKHAFLIPNTEASRWIERNAFNRLTQRTPRETRKAAVAGIQRDNVESTNKLERITSEIR
ncbi:hypothetical protein BC827DRAFT_1239295, partial [Russula dissimulans]